jgi:RAD50-interacting protein 1
MLARLKATNAERTSTVLTSAQDAALSRHVLTDDLTALSAELVSPQERAAGRATLLEDLEDMHRKLKELQNVQHYVRVIEQALRLRYAFSFYAGLLSVISRKLGCRSTIQRSLL